VSELDLSIARPSCSTGRDRVSTFAGCRPRLRSVRSAASIRARESTNSDRSSSASRARRAVRRSPWIRSFASSAAEGSPCAARACTTTRRTSTTDVKRPYRRV
jgi:hypothetical protein